VYSGLVKRHESLKKYIKTIIDQLPQYIELYPPDEQELLKEFLSIVAFYEEADFQRQELSNKIENYRQEIISRENYLILPFSWFIGTYFQNARVLLSISKFHAKDFFEYLVKHFRGNSQVPGAFELIRKNISLSNLAWENLQYECNKLLVPLTNDQIQILETIFAYIKKTGIYSLDPRRLKTEIINQVQIPSNVKPLAELKRFFSLIEATWFIRFFSPAFGLDRLFFHIQLNRSSSLPDLIGYQNPRNTVLNISDIYKVRELTDTYIGVLYIPTQDMDLLIKYFKHLESENLLVLYDLQKLTIKCSTSSLFQYKPDSGWKLPSQSAMNSLASSITSKSSKREEKKQKNLYIPPPFNSEWHFTKHPLPCRIIKLYCEIPQRFSYTELPLGSIRNQRKNYLTTEEIGLIKQLYYNQVVQIGFIPWQIVFEFSMDEYNIKIPKLQSSKLNQLLKLLPQNEIYETEKNIIIWTRFPKNLKEWMKEKLNWEVNNISIFYYPSDLNYNWFNEEKLQWNTPEILLT